MKPPILGIVAIFIFQLAFVAYSSADRLMGMKYDAPAELAAPPISIAELPDDSPQFHQLLPEDRISGQPQRHFAAEQVNLAAHTKTRRRTRAKNSGLTAKNLEERWPPVVITVRRSPEFTFTAASARVKPAVKRLDAPKREAVSEPKREKKSLIAKALPIIKKPYSWLKAVGSVFK